MKRNGSALLIVLGVLSFLVVSAVAFSAFMRRARLPSSYLRRTVSSRELAKAAVSEVIDIIDQSINSNVHPGIGNNVADGCSRDNALLFRPRNEWSHRIYMPPAKYGDDIKTVPTLTLEGLAYIPPPLINEARYYSRLTPTAMWQPFGYDVGRYAFCVIDVSDYLDVNRLVAGYPRSSAANSRITIAHLFEKGASENGDWDHPDPPENADKWDDFMDEFRTFTDDPIKITYNDKVPLVSLADFNLALHAKRAIGNLKSPFGEYVKNKNSTFYPTTGDEGTAALETYASMTFVTDGLFPKNSDQANAGNSESPDLANSKFQPIQMGWLKADEGGKSKLTLEGALSGMGFNNDDEWIGRLSSLGCAALVDYLDEDSTPLSLAMPSNERVPMICGISPALDGLSLAIRMDKGESNEPDETTDIDATHRTAKKTVSWKIDGAKLTEVLAKGHVQVLATYPFLHKTDKDPKVDYDIDGRLAFFFTSEDMGLRAKPQTRDEFEKTVLVLKEKGSEGIASKLDSENGLLSVKLPKIQVTSNMLKTLSAEEDITKMSDAVWDSETTFGLSDGSDLPREFNKPGKELLKVTYSWEQTRADENEEWTPSVAEIMKEDAPGAHKIEIVEATCGFPALTAKGIVDPTFTNSDKLKEHVAKPNDVKDIKLNVAVWLRVRDAKSGTTLDMVPACVLDDKLQAGKPPILEQIDEIASEFAGDPYPVMRFDTGVTLKFGVKALSDDVGNDHPGEVKPKAVMVGDPRFNYAPEHWFAWNDEMSVDKWLEQNYAAGKKGDADDIFIATSDAGYLQSIYELAFLPCLTRLKSDGSAEMAMPERGDLKKPDGLNTFAARGAERNSGFMWLTYDPFGNDSAALSALAKLYPSGATGIKINPYSDSTNVLMAAFANTPVDWRCASTNVEFSFARKIRGGRGEGIVDVASFNEKYAWNSYNESATFRWYDLEKIAGRFMDEICPPDKRNSDDSKSIPWETAWDKLGWYADTNKSSHKFLGATMDADSTPLWSVDRKFLYGFWRDCFDAKQQLFLIFVRAEPLLLGGGSADQLPPQLGARAVALVWRDPTTSGKANNGYPHRTRLLFYRPLD